MRHHGEQFKRRVDPEEVAKLRQEHFRDHKALACEKRRGEKLAQACKAWRDARTAQEDDSAAMALLNAIAAYDRNE
jgi:hypothetical protein